MTVLRALVAIIAVASVVTAQEPVSFRTSDGVLISGIVYGRGDRGVVLVHGGRFNKESWDNQARLLAATGFRVLAIDVRGFGQSRWPGREQGLSAPFQLDVLAAVRYFRRTGVKTVSLVGGSMGGAAAADACNEAKPGERERVVVLAAIPEGPPEKLTCPKLFIVARDDANGAGPRQPGIRAYFEKTPEPKQLIVLDGSAHAQFLFQTDQGDRVMREILRFVSTP